MARIRILQLPPYGRDGEQPFALIVDQFTDPEGNAHFGWGQFGQQIGARGVLVTPERVDIAEDDDVDALVEFDQAALMETVKTAVRAHLESAEASDAFRADVDRRRAAAGEATTQVRHYHFIGSPTLDHERLERWANDRDKRQGGESA